jgi:hypothetical protein
MAGENRDVDVDPKSRGNERKIGYLELMRNSTEERYWTKGSPGVVNGCFHF